MTNRHLNIVHDSIKGKGYHVTPLVCHVGYDGYYTVLTGASRYD